MELKRVTLIGILLSACLSQMSPGLPGKKDWMQGIKTERFQDTSDGVFLVDRGWIQGQVKTISATDITLVSGSTEHIIRRSEVSLIELSDWLRPEKRGDEGLIKVRIELAGEAECADFFFGDGTIIKQVDAGPSYTEGKDRDDRASAGLTHIRFDKGREDRSATVVQVDLSLLPGQADVLHCETYCGRANVTAGPYSVRFMDPAEGTPLVVMKKPLAALWFKLDVPLAKLGRARYPFRTTAVAWQDVKMSRISALDPPSSSNPKVANDARCILFDGQVVEGELVSMDDSALLVQIRPVGPPDRVPRAQVAFIELYDWETPLRNPASRNKGGGDVTPPIRIVFAGTSSEGQIDLNPGDAIHELIMPPHHVSVRDFEDIAYVKNERVLGYNNARLDRSPSQVEAIVRLKLGPAASVKAHVHNHYTNILAGDMQLLFYRALTGKKIWASPKSSQRVQQWDLKIQRSKLFR